MNNFIKKLTKYFLLEDVSVKKIGFFPGSFRPPHAGHYEFLKNMLKNNDVVYVINSTSKNANEERNFDYTKSIKIFDIYKRYLLEDINKLKFIKINSPIKLLYDLVLLLNGENTEENELNKYVLDYYNEISGGYEKFIINLYTSDDDNRYSGFSNKKYQGNNVLKINILKNDRIGGYSASNFRMAIENKDIKKMVTFLPNDLSKEDVKKVINIICPNEIKNINEGGNVFSNVSVIKKENIDSTLKEFDKEFKNIFSKVNLNYIKLGSVGKKEFSGDLDLGIDSSLFFNKNKLPNLNIFDIDKKEFNDLFIKFKSRSRTSSDYQIMLRVMLSIISKKINSESLLMKSDDKSSGNGMLSISFPQFNEKGKVLKNNVQIDLMVGNLDWLNFSYYSEKYIDNVKGLHRTQLIVSLFSNKGYIFSHNSGVKDKNTNKIVASKPEELLELLNKIYKISLNIDILQNYFKLQKYLVDNLNKVEYNNIIDIYLRILDSTRADIPFDLQKYWKDNKNRLNLTGKYLPNDSKLLMESGVAGGDRVPNNLINDIIKDYVNNVLNNYSNYVSYVVTGGTSLNKKDHGDVDIIVNVFGDNKSQSKKEFANYVSKLPNDVIVPFKNKKYLNKKYYISGELVTILFKYNNLYVQIDNNISFSKEEANFKQNFLNLPSDKQGLITGLVRVAVVEENYKDIFKRLNIKLKKVLEKDEEFEFVLSGQKLTLRLVKLDNNFKEIERKEIWSSNSWNDVEKLLIDYDLSLNFSYLLEYVSKRLSERSKKRVKGLFNSLVSVKSGEVGTEKGKSKEISKNLINKML